MLNFHLQATHTFSLMYIWFKLKALSTFSKGRFSSPPHCHSLPCVRSKYPQSTPGPNCPIVKTQLFQFSEERQEVVPLFVSMVIALHFTWVQTCEPGGRWRADTAGRVRIPATCVFIESSMNSNRCRCRGQGCRVCVGHIVVRNLELNLGLSKGGASSV